MRVMNEHRVNKTSYNGPISFQQPLYTRKTDEQNQKVLFEQNLSTVYHLAHNTKRNRSLKPYFRTIEVRGPKTKFLGVRVK